MSSQTNATILVIDDEKYICNMIRDVLSTEPFQVVVYHEPEEALKYIDEHPVDLVLTDLVMGNHSGVEVLDATLRNSPDAIVLIMTAHPTVETAISVIKNGAYDFLVKPFKMELLKATIRRGLEHQQIRREYLELKGQVEFLKTASFGGSAGENIEKYLAHVVKSCKKEIGAVAAGIILTGPEKTETSCRVYEADEKEHVPVVLDESTLLEFSYTKSPQPVISSNCVIQGGSKTHQIRISQPVFIGRKLIGVINILTYRKFDRVLSGELHMLGILSNFAASSIANWLLYHDLQKSYMNAIKGLANAIEARDIHTAGHTDRVCRLAEVVATYLGWSALQIKDLMMGCTLHDIGKIGVPDSLLNKPEKLSRAEHDRMENHTTLGLRIIEEIDLFKPAIPYIISHHERFDGTGYPAGLKGENIPVEGRLLAVVDTFDAILSDRPYRPGASLQLAITEIDKNRKTQFDPQMVDALFAVIRTGQIDIETMYDRKEDVDTIAELKVTERARA